MMNIKLKLALLRQSSEEGAILPVILGMGLIMTLTGLTMIIRSSDEQLTAQAQKATASSLSAGEAGITRTQSMLNNNRTLAGKNMKGVGETWANADEWFGGGGCEGYASIGQARAYSNSTWQTLGSNDRDGQFKVVDYIYTPVPGVNPSIAAPGTILGNGELRVAGRINETGTGDVPRASVSSLSVSIPVRKTNPNTFNLGAMWLKEGSIPSNNQINADLLVSGCNAEIGGTVAAGRQRLAIPGSGFPDLPTRPVANFYDLRGTTVTGGTFPRSGDVGINENGVEVFRYRINNIDLSSGGTNMAINVNATRRVIFYLEGNLDTGSKDITNNSNRPENFQIYGYGSNPGNPLEPHVCMNGSGTVNGFLFAPEYNVGIAGSGGNAGFIGAIWARQWNPHPGGISSCGSNTSNTVASVSNPEIDLSALDLNLGSIKMPPTLSAISQWQRKEVQ